MNVGNLREPLLELTSFSPHPDEDPPRSETPVVVITSHSGCMNHLKRWGGCYLVMSVFGTVIGYILYARFALPLPRLHK